MNKLSKDFPALQTNVGTREIIYVDNASTTQNPKIVTDQISAFYNNGYANVDRGIYALAEETTIAYEDARTKVAQFIGADAQEIIFTKGTTESINFVATAWGLTHLKKGDEIVLTELEHHANLIPWQQVAHKTGAVLKFIPINDDGSLNLDSLDSIITSKTKFVGCIHISNALGTTVDIKKVIAAARAVGAPILIDAAQSVPHIPVDVHSLDCDFLVFSGHKMCGPTGIGVLYIAKRMFESVPPYQFGGSMINHATYQTATFAKPPAKYEAGTPPIAQAIGLAHAIDYLTAQVDFKTLGMHEAGLCSRFIDGLQKMERIRILGPIDQLKKEGHLVSFTVDGLHAHDVAAALDMQGIYVRAGHFCAQPLFTKLGITAAVRASFYFYNSPDQVDALLVAIKKMPVLS